MFSSVKYISKKTLILTLTLNPNPNARFYQDKLENYGINVVPDKNRFRKVKTSPYWLYSHIQSHA